MSTSLPNIEMLPDIGAVPGMDQDTAWKQEVNERLAAHRTRRTRKNDRNEEHPTLPGMDADGPLKSSIAARVAARYAKAPTYSEMLAAEAQNAVNAATAAANAAHQAQAAAQAILTGLDIRPEANHEAKQEANYGSHQAPYWPARPAEPVRRETRPETRPETRGVTGGEARNDARSETRREPWQDASAATHAAPAAAPSSFVAAAATPSHAAGLRIKIAEEPAESAAYEEPTPLPANLIEFPRELFATRRARPRLAEGPLRDESTENSGEPQLRIFEVEAQSISTVAAVEHTQTEWSSIRLGAHPAVHPAQYPAEQDQQQVATAPLRSASNLELPLQTAALEDRSMAAIVDLALVTGAFLLFVLAFAFCTPHLPMGKGALMAAAAAYLVIALGYQLLFFAFAESTPGMRYAKIALCTFDDENPTRNAMKVRVAAMLLSLCPVGLGCAWVFFDEDHLSWHDRITRTYQRSYR